MLSSQELDSFDAQRDAIDNQYATGLVRNTDQFARLDLDQGIQSDRLTRNLRATRQRLPGGFAGRGLLNSGFYNQSLQDFNQGALDSQADLVRQFAARRDGLFDQLQSLDTNRAIQLAQVDLNQQARRSAVAALLGSVR